VLIALQKPLRHLPRMYTHFAETEAGKRLRPGSTSTIPRAGTLVRMR
jgi:hypothetical protein